MKVIKGLTVSASLAAFMAMSSPAKAAQLLDHETLDQGYANSAPASNDDEKKDDDVRVERGPITVVVDAMSLQYLMGAEIDYEDNLEGARFVIRNPNASSTCGCGSSFSV